MRTMVVRRKVVWGSRENAVDLTGEKRSWWVRVAKTGKKKKKKEKIKRIKKKKK